MSFFTFDIIRIARRRIRRRSSSRHSVSKTSVAHYALYKEAARILVHKKILKFNSMYHFKVGRVAIRNTRSRWGSCSSKGNLNFNYKIALLPEQMADYIVIHELCHLGEFNHSENFWNLVLHAMPEYKVVRDELKKKGMSFF